MHFTTDSTVSSTAFLTRKGADEKHEIGLTTEQSG